MTDYSTKKLPELNIKQLNELTGSEDVLINQNGGDYRIKSSLIINESGNEFDYIALDTNPPVITDEGTLLWNNKEYTINVNTGLGATIQVGQEVLVLYYNNTGATISNFKALHPIGGAVIGGLPLPTVEFASSKTWEKCQGTMWVATHDVEDGALGLGVRFGKARNGDTTPWGAGVQLWLSDDDSGDLVAVQPEFPSYQISMGGTLNDDVSNGEIFISITTDVGDTFHEAWDGCIRESFDFTVDSDGIDIIGTLKNVDPNLNLTLKYRSGFYTLDTTSADLTIQLTEGTDTDTVTQYVYIPITTKVLTISASGFPETEHAKVARLEIESAITVQTNGGCRRNQNINDHVKKEDNNGHILHITHRIRQLNAEHSSGTLGTLDNTGGNGYMLVSGGVVWQMHEQKFPAFSMVAGDKILAVNDFTTAYNPLSNLAAITAYSTGAGWNNEWGTIVVWGVANKTGQPSPVMFNLPSDGYNSEDNAIADSNGYANYTIPKKYKGVGFLIGAYTFRLSGGVLTYNGGAAYVDLRGFVPNNIAGGGSGSGITSLLGLEDVFISSYTGKKGDAVIINNLETGIVTEKKTWFYNIARTFKAIFNIESLTVDRTYTMPDKDGTVAMLSDITGRTYKENDSTINTRAARNVITNAFAGLSWFSDDPTNDESDESPQLFLLNDVDPTGKAAGDIPQVNSTNDGVNFASSAPYTDYQAGLPIVISGVVDITHTLLGFLIEQGYAVEGYVNNDSAVAVTGFRLTDGTNDMFTAFDLSASERGKRFTVSDSFFDPDNDQDVYYYVTTGNSANLTVYFTVSKK